VIITRMQHRISVFGGGTDYRAWSRQHGGRVLSATIVYEQQSYSRAVRHGLRKFNRFAPC